MWRAHYERRVAQGKPTTIDELLEWSEEAGTHTVIDITRVGSTPDFGAATPLSAAQLRAFFGTTTLTCAQAEAAHEALDAQIEQCWQAVYFAVYDGDVPAAWCFVGVSGD